MITADEVRRRVRAVVETVRADGRRAAARKFLATDGKHADAHREGGESFLDVMLRQRAQQSH